MSGTSGYAIPKLETNVTLTINYTKGTWSAILSSALADNINISNLTALGWKDSATCVGGITNSCNNDLSIAAGQLSDEFKNSGTAGNDIFGCEVKYYRILPSVIINGVSTTNGHRMQIGNQILSVAIQHAICSPYTC